MVSCRVSEGRSVHSSFEAMQAVFPSRRTLWLRKRYARRMANDSTNFTRWKPTWEHHNCGIVWDTAANEWAGEEDWATHRKNVEVRSTQGVFFKRPCWESVRVPFEHLKMNTKQRESGRPEKETRKC